MKHRKLCPIPPLCGIVRAYDPKTQGETFEVVDGNLMCLWAGTKRHRLRKWLVQRDGLDLYNDAVADWNDADADAAKVKKGLASRFGSLREFLRGGSPGGPTWRV